MTTPKPHASDARSPGAPKLVRLQRWMADAGVAARRACEQLIEDGRVKVNGRIARELPVFINPHEDRVEVGGRIIQPLARHVYIMLHKPERVLVAAADEPGLERTKVTDLVKHALAPRLFPVGRLEWDAQGLVLLTTDGEFAQRLTHPRYSVPKVYRAQVKGEVVPERTPELQAAIRRQAKLAIKRDAALRRQEAKQRGGGGPLVVGAGGGGVARRKEWFLAPVVRVLERSSGAAEWAEQREAQGATLEVTLLESRGAPLRDLLFAVGLPVRRLTRVGVGMLRLGALKVGDWRELSGEEVRDLMQTPAWDGSELREMQEVPQAQARRARPAGDRVGKPRRGMSERAMRDREERAARRKAARATDRSISMDEGRAGAEGGSKVRPQGTARRALEGPSRGAVRGSDRGSVRGPNQGSSRGPAKPPSRGPRGGRGGEPRGEQPRKGPRTILPE